MAGVGIGMMDPAYFVGRAAILGWLNEAFQLALTKIEDTASGAVACQVLDAIYPGEVPMQKVRWDARGSHEFIDNYKIIQRVFERKGIEKHIEIERLMRAKYQDNLENMQWFMSFFDKNYSGAPYDPVSRRLKGRGSETFAIFATAGKVAGPRVLPTSGSVAPGEAGGAAAPPAAAPTQARAAASAGPSTSSRPRRTASTSPSRAGGGSGAAAAAKVQELTAQVTDLRLSVESLEKERDFYFGKLRDIEILLQSYAGPDKATADTIFKILYATDDDFVQVDDEMGGAGNGV